MATKADRPMMIHLGVYLATTAHLSAAEHGAYLLLLMHSWQHGGTIPDSDQQLQSITRMSDAEWGASRDVLLGFFGGCLN